MGGYMSDQIVSSLEIEESTSSLCPSLLPDSNIFSTLHNDVSEGL
jgi:hypothetical protein